MSSSWCRDAAVGDLPLRCAHVHIDGLLLLLLIVRPFDVVSGERVLLGVTSASFDCEGEAVFSSSIRESDAASLSSICDSEAASASPVGKSVLLGVIPFFSPQLARGCVPLPATGSIRASISRRSRARPQKR